MLSRVADALYWSSRYVERAENVARFINVNLDQMLDSPAGERPSWEPLVMTTGDQEWFAEHYGEATPEAVTRFLTFDARYPNSILSAVSAARENGRMVRNIIPREMWQELNELYLMVTSTASQPTSPEDMADFFDRVKLAGIHYAGVTDATLSRGEAWHFVQLGRMIERADKTSRILDVKYFILLPSPKDIGTTVDQVGWTALLSSASALQMYRQLHHVIDPDKVADFLLLNRDFPRSIHWCVARAQKSLHAITGAPLDSFSTSAERLLGRLRSSLDYEEIGNVVRSGLHEYLDRVQATLNDVGTAVRERFFALNG